MDSDELISIILKKQKVIDELLIKLKAKNICDNIHDLENDQVVIP